MKLLQLCGISLASGSRQLLHRAAEMPIDLLFIRDDDIPNFVAEGICDLGICGQNIHWEERCRWQQQHTVPFSAQVYKKLNFSHCRLSLAAPREFEQTYRQHGIRALEQTTIATSYPASLQQFLAEHNVSAEIVSMNGSVELAPQLQIADLICDLISTGSTLVANNLVECERVLDSEAILLENSISKNTWREEKSRCWNQLQTRIESVLRARNSKYVMMNAPKDKVEKICSLLPGIDSPTIIPLKDPNQVAIHVVSAEPVFWETMEALKEMGAHSILIQPIEKMLL